MKAVVKFLPTQITIDIEEGEEEFFLADPDAYLDVYVSDVDIEHEIEVLDD